MSSVNVRTLVNDFLTANWITTPFFDLSDFTTNSDLPINTTDSWLGIQYFGGVEDIQSIPAKCYRETGAISFHIVSPSGFTSTAALTLCEQLRDLLRDRRLGSLYFMEVRPPTDQSGKAIKFDGAWNGFVIETVYWYDIAY